MVGLDLAQVDHQFIVFSVTDDRRVQDVIAVVVKVDLLLELFVSLSEMGSVHVGSRLRVRGET
jgi:hypothetical protein